MTLMRFLKYQDRRIKQIAYNSGEILTLRLRYKRPDENESIELSEILHNTPVELEKTSNNFRFSACVAEFAMLLRDSEFKGNSNFDSVIKTAKKSKGKDQFGYRAEFIDLIERTEMLTKQ